MALTWAINESEYNIALKPNVEKSIQLLEQSEALEPNAAYTVSALGIRYFFTYDYTKAFAKFQKYLDLRPNDFYSKYSLVLIYTKLKQFEKAESLFKELISKNEKSVLLHAQLFDSYFNQGKKSEASACATKIKDS